MRFPPAARCSGDFGPLIFLCSAANVVTARWHRAAGAWTIPRSDVALLFHISNAASLLAELEMASPLRQLCSAAVRLLFSQAFEAGGVGCLTAVEEDARFSPENRGQQSALMTPL